MKGYFTRLAKQSGLAIGASNRSARARPGPLQRVAPDSAAAPPHVETVVLVDSLPSVEEVGFDSRSVGNSARHQVASEVGRQPQRTEPELSSKSEPAGRGVPASDVTNSSIATPLGDSHKQIAEPSETRVFTTGSTELLPLDKASESEPAVAGSISDELEEQSLEERSEAKPGVVRVGEFRSSGDLNLAPEPDSLLALEPDSFTEGARVISRQEPSIPRDYLEGIREWLASPPIMGGEIQTESAADQKPEQVSPEKVSNDLLPAERTLRANFGGRDPAVQNDIREFSLSIGSISIIVEEPPGQPIEQSQTVQPVASPPVSAQPRARDAFALSRSYFRGF